MLQFLSEMLWWNVLSEMFRPKCVKVIDPRYKFKNLRNKVIGWVLARKIEAQKFTRLGDWMSTKPRWPFLASSAYQNLSIACAKNKKFDTFSEIKLSVTFLMEKVKPKSLEKEDEYRDRLGHLYHFEPFWTIRTRTEGSKIKTFFAEKFLSMKELPFEFSMQILRLMLFGN